MPTNPSIWKMLIKPLTWLWQFHFMTPLHFIQTKMWKNKNEKNRGFFGCFFFFTVLPTIFQQSFRFLCPILYYNHGQCVATKSINKCWDKTILMVMLKNSWFLICFDRWKEKTPNRASLIFFFLLMNSWKNIGRAMFHFWNNMQRF